MYRYAILDPRPSGAAINDTIISSAPVGVYGIEVTIPALAARCQLGNLDPQHTEGRDVAACVAALTCPLPPDGATLVTVRPDADSVLAMALLELRRRDATVREDRVHLIGQADSAQAGPWVRDYRPPPAFAAVNAVAMDHRKPLERRIALLISWAAGGRGPLPDPPNLMANDDAPHAELSACGRYAIVHADGPAGRGACAAGYQLAPIVIAINQAFQFVGGEPHLKYTIARWNATHVPMDWTDMLAKLQTLEPGWGGSGSICGSPQGVGSTLTLDQVEFLVQDSLPSEIRWTDTGQFAYLDEQPVYSRIECAHPECGYAFLATTETELELIGTLATGHAWNHAQWTSGHMTWECSGRYGHELDTATCGKQGCGWISWAGQSGGSDLGLEDFRAYAAAHDKIHYRERIGV